MGRITCTICKRDYWDWQNHTCGEAYEVRDPDDKEAEIFYSKMRSLDDVACDYVEYRFYDWNCPEESDVEIRDLLSGGDWKKFCVTVEPVPSFAAQEYSKHKCDECGTEFDTLSYRPDLCRKCDIDRRKREYEEWRKREGGG